MATLDDVAGTPGGGALTLPAPAKINLGLEVLGRREDGFHELQTVFQTLELADLVTLRPHDGPTCTICCDEPGIPPGPANLALRAAESYLSVNKAPACEIHLEKHIPAGGGLGGGSSDAAAVLRGLQRLAPAPLETAVLADLAVHLGSDVPFFLAGGTAWATGRGEILTPLEDLGDLEDITLVLPPFGCATPACFQALSDEERGPRHVRKPFDWMGLWKHRRREALANRLGDAALRVEPRLATVRDWVRRTGLPHGMSGSGSTFYVLGTTDLPAPEGCRLLVTRARGRGDLNRLR